MEPGDVFYMEEDPELLIILGPQQEDNGPRTGLCIPKSEFGAYYIQMGMLEWVYVIGRVPRTIEDYADHPPKRQRSRKKKHR